MSGFTHCNECTDFLEGDAYCHCCYTGTRARLAEAEAKLAQIKEIVAPTPKRPPPPLKQLADLEREDAER